MCSSIVLAVLSGVLFVWDAHINVVLATVQVIRMVGESQEAVGVGGGSGPSSNKMPTLEEYGTNLTTQATEVWPPCAAQWLRGAKCKFKGLVFAFF